MKKILIALTAWLVSLGCLAQENNYLATVWGAKSDGITDNTASFQRAIDSQRALHVQSALKVTFRANHGKMFARRKIRIFFQKSHKFLLNYLK